VDHVIDIEQEQFPFPDNSVSHVFSSHCLEHLKYPLHLLREIARVSREGAEVEIWTPYAFSNGAFMYSHLHFLTEDHYSHMCILFPEVYKTFTGAYWNWHGLTYIVSLNVAIEIHRASVPLDFALKYYKNVALEFGVRMTAHKAEWNRVDPVRYVSMERDGARYELPSVPPIGQPETEAYLQTLSSMSRVLG